MSQWGWHSFPLPDGCTENAYQKTPIKAINGRNIYYDLPNPKQNEISSWLAGNPHKFKLGRIGLRLFLKNGRVATEKDLSNPLQEIDLWRGIITSRFEIEGIPVIVKTACHPNLDMIGVQIESNLIASKRLSVFIDFPYADTKEKNTYLGCYNKTYCHKTDIQTSTDHSTILSRKMDDTSYYVTLNWDTDAKFISKTEISPHCFELVPESHNKLNFNCLFSQKIVERQQEDVFKASQKAWKVFWESGAAVDFSGSTDPRWRELERRIILSQYVMRINEAGTLPPQESGLVNNSWYGRLHFEMIWWHGVHYALWNRWNLLDKSLSIYKKFLPSAKKRANAQGYEGARWPKCTGNIDREWPHLIHATLIWQQPHPIYFAELDYRLHPNKQTLEKWKDIVIETANFMASLAYYDNNRKQYVLGAPLYIVSENTDPMNTLNPAFELSYWKYGLRVAQEWRKRLNLAEEQKWKDVENNLSPLPVENGIYTTYEGISDMWTKYNFEHPALIGTFGMLPGDGVDEKTFKKTLDQVYSTWNFGHVWGWDFPMLAMAAARTGNPNWAIDFLLYPSPNFQFDEHGLATGGPFPYFPSNGALLTAVAMMIGGWDGATNEFPGFPKDGTWKIKAENFNKLP